MVHLMFSYITLLQVQTFFGMVVLNPFFYRGSFDLRVPGQRDPLDDLCQRPPLALRSVGLHKWVFVLWVALVYQRGNTFINSENDYVINAVSKMYVSFPCKKESS